MQTAIIYTRVSSAEQVQGTSLDTQEADCAAYCKRKGYAVAKVFREAGESAKTTDRPQLQAALKFCKEKKPHKLVVWKLDRLSRNTLDGLQLQAQLSATGTRLESATESIEANESGDLVATILLAVAQLDNKQRAKRVRRGLEAVAMAGGWTHTAPTGYLTSQNATLVHDAETAPHIKNLFGQIASGTTTTTEAIEHFKSRFPGKLTKSVIYRILRNPIYCGIIKSRLTDFTEVKAKFDGIVSPKTFYAVQGILGRKHMIIQKLNPGIPLRGLIHCKVCGRMLTGGMATGRGGKKYAHYFCSTKCVKISGIKVEKEIERILSNADFLTSPLTRLKSLASDFMKTDIDTGRTARDAAHNALAPLRKRLDKLTDGWLNGVIDEATYKSQAAVIRQQITNQQEILDAEIFDVNQFTSILEKTIEILSDPLAIYHALESSKKLLFLESVFGRFECCEKGVLHFSNRHKDNIFNMLQYKK